METRAFQTPLGKVWLRGEADVFSERKPLIFVIGGSFQSEHNRLLELRRHLPDADLLFAHLPGNHCPELSEVSVTAYAAAFDHVLTGFDRPTVLCGTSIGGAAALAMRSPQIGRILLLDPPLATAKLWPLFEFFRNILEAEPDGWRARFIQSVFGIYPDRVEERGYAALLHHLRAPTVTLVASQPLMPGRPIENLPSLVDEPERALLRQCTRLIEVPDVGHKLALMPILRCMRLLAGDLALVS